MTPEEFVGQTRELASLRSLVTRKRLISLTGPGGIGKSRLAAEAARAERASFETIQVVDVDKTAVNDIHVAGAPALLVLDNVDRELDACASLVERLLWTVPSLHVLTTGREPLRLRGETVHRMTGMSKADSQRLLSALVPALADDPDALASLCERLEGLPLALLLAAPHLKTLDAETVRRHVDDDPDFLSGGESTLPRHRSLRESFAWSFARLTPAERAALASLSVLPDEFGLDAMGAVCGDLPAATVLDLAHVLLTRSLITAGAGARKLFRLPASIRPYAAEALVNSGNADETRDRLAGWLAAICDPLRDRVVLLHDELEPILRVEGLLREAVDHARAIRDPRYPLLATGLARCWHDNGQLAAARELLDSVAGSASVLLHAAWLALVDGDYEHAAGKARHVDLAGQAEGLRCLLRGDFAAASTLCTELLTRGRVREAALVRHGIAWTALQAGDLLLADALMQETLPLLLADAEPLALSAALHTSGAIALLLDDLERADGLFTRSLDLADLPCDKLAYHLEGLAVVATLRQRTDRALRLAGGARALRGGAEAEPQWAEFRDRSLSLPARHAHLAAGAKLSREQLVHYARTDEWASSGAAPTLTPRQREVAEYLAQGLPNRQIAARMRVSERTVRVHLEKIRERLGLESRVELALWLGRNSR